MKLLKKSLAMYCTNMFILKRNVREQMTPTLLPKTRFHKSFKIQLYTIEYLANCLDKGIYPDNLEYAAIIPIF